MALELEYGFTKIGIMKTTVDIPDKELADAMKFSHAKTKREAIVTAITDFNHRKRLAALTKNLGTFDSILPNTDIEALESRKPGRS